MTTTRPCVAAHAKGDEFLADNADLFDELHDKNIRITRWDEHIHNNLYHETRAVLKNIFVGNALFKEMIEKDAVSFVTRMMRRKEELAVEYDQAVWLCCEYLMEEIAVFSALSEQGLACRDISRLGIVCARRSFEGQFRLYPAGTERQN